MRIAHSTFVFAGALIIAASSLATKPAAKTKDDGMGHDEPANIARAYLKALDGSAPGDARAFLLGDVTLDAELATIPNWKLEKRDAVKHEEADLAKAIADMRKLDKAGRKALDTLLNQPGGDGFAQVGRAEAEKIMAPTKAVATKFKKDFPIFSYMARVDKEVYWHPKNPWRRTLEKLGKTGVYTISYHRFNIRETDHGRSRVWPLRVLRIKTKNYDSGWKILPASDWDPES